MKLPRKPPDWREHMATLDAERLMRAITSSKEHSTKTEYLHWDKLVYLQHPEGLSHDDWWLGIKLGRHQLYKTIPLLDNKGKPFRYLLPDPIPEQLHHIDLGAGGKIGVPKSVINPETRDQYYVSSLIEEAITSSQLEGAVTTRDVAKEMIQSARKPRDRSEQMILNNFHAMQKIGEIKNVPLTKEVIFELHRIVTENALDNPLAVGRFRLPDEDIVVADIEGDVFHTPPAATELEERMTAMCAFANGETPEHFIHPAVRSIILHFWLAYDHPFVDGNGRTARALFYWSMLRHGFWLSEFISISRIILKAPLKYARAFLDTETDENDLTYFINYHVEVIRRALNDLDQYIEERAERLRTTERDLRNLIFLNHRQQALIVHALRHPRFFYTTEGHRLTHNVAYQTASNDLKDLKNRGLLVAIKSGKTRYYTPPTDLATRLAALA